MRVTWRGLGTALAWLLSWRFLEQVLPRVLVGYVAAGTGIALISRVIGAVLSQSPIANVSMLYLLVVLATAIRFGSGPAVFASVGAFLTYDWFFIEPVHNFSIADPEEWVALLLFLLVSIVTGQLAVALRRRAEEAQRREREARALHELGRILNAHNGLDQALRHVAEHLWTQLGIAGVAMLLPEDPVRGGRAVVRAVAGLPPPPGEQTQSEWMAAPSDSATATGPGRRWVRVHDPRQRAARGAPHRATFVPLKVANRTVGVLRLAQAPDAAEWPAEDARLVAAAADQIALAVERARLRQEATAAEVLRQTDEARKALLASVSHDLRTPLASIKASAGSLLQDDVRWTEEERRGFATAIEQESDRLNRLVSNLLDMSRIEAGALRPDRDWYPLDAVVDDVVGRLHSALAGHHVVMDVPDTLPPLPLDYVQVGEVFANLLENAVKYTPPGSTIRITARQEQDALGVTLEDDGPGIPPAALPHVFDKFYRVSGGDTARTMGTGLGLSVVRGIVEGHGGTVTAVSPPPGRPRGAAFRFTLPLAVPGAPPPLDVRPPAAAPDPDPTFQLPAPGLAQVTAGAETGT